MMSNHSLACNDFLNNNDPHKDSGLPFDLPPHIPEHLVDAVKEQAIKMWNCGTQKGNKQWSLNDFEIGTRIGRGGFGRVYLARDKVAHSYVALKIISKAKIIAKQIEHNVVREIEIQSRLYHSNIIRLYTYFSDSKNIYLVLEYAGGGELYHHLQNSPLRRFSETTAAKYIYQVANALQYCHMNKVIHRDVKPENLLLGLDGNIKLSDFGFSVHTPSLKRKTQCGTVCYLPPEMIHKRSYDERIDNWCLGILCYELLVGTPPFGWQDEKEILHEISSFTEISYPPYISSEAKDLISNLLQKNPSERLTLLEVMQHKWIVTNLNANKNLNTQIQQKRF